MTVTEMESRRGCARGRGKWVSCVGAVGGILVMNVPSRDCVSVVSWCDALQLYAFGGNRVTGIMGLPGLFLTITCEFTIILE